MNASFIRIGLPLLALIGLCICGLFIFAVALILWPQPSGPQVVNVETSAAPVRPTDQALPTASPTQSPAPLPTFTPFPTATAAPALTPTPARASLNVSRASLKQTYEKLGFIFAEAAPVDGQPHLIGKSPLAAVEMIGPPDNLTQATLMFAATTRPQENSANLINMIALLNAVAPGWTDRVNWLTSAFSQAAATGQASTTYNHINFELTAHKEIGLILLTVKGIPNSP